jgi:hypothetical protein
MGQANLARAPQYRIERCAESYEQLFERVRLSRTADPSPVLQG